MTRLVIGALLALLLTGPALAAESRPERPHWSLELKGGAFFPGVDNWSTFYGKSYLGEFGGALSYKLERRLEVGIEGSYLSTNGKGTQPQHLQQGASLPPGGEVSYQQAPLNLFVLARGIFREDQWLVPYAAAGATRMFYQAEVKGQGKTRGSVNGYHARGGLQFLLDDLERGAADNLYLDYGIHHTYLLLEAKYTRAMVDTNSGGAVNIGGSSWLGGLLLEF